MCERPLKPSGGSNEKVQHTRLYSGLVFGNSGIGEKFNSGKIEGFVF